MQNIVNIVKRLLPTYAVMPLGAMLLLNWIAYFGSRLYTTGRVHYSLETAWDRALPLLPVFIVVYYLAFVQWILCYLRIAWEGENYAKKVFLGEMIAKLLCMLIFLVYPTTIVRPEIMGSGLFESLTRKLYLVDAADNLFPSIHCLESWACFRGSLGFAKKSKIYTGLVLVFSLLVFASTVLLKQHVLLDIPAGILVFEIGYFISRKIWRKP